MNKIKIISVAFIIMLGACTVTFTKAEPNMFGNNPMIPATTREIANPKKQEIPTQPEVKPAANNVQPVQQKVQAPQKNYMTVNPVEMVNFPSRYMNKNVKFRAKFDKFATLGLDYKPAFRSSEKYISFLIQRCDVTTHNVPLSELKIFLERTEAEKHIDLDSGDEIEVAGHVFSNALGDVWMDAEQFTVLSKKTNTANNQ